MHPKEAFAERHRVLFLDVRERYEWDEGHIRSAVHVPIGEVAARLKDLKKDVSVVVVCQVGQRSALVAELLEGHGREAHNLDGGLQAWVEEGLPLVSSEGLPGRVIDGWARDITGRRITRA